MTNINTYKEATESLEQIESKYRSFADSVGMYDFEFDINYDFEEMTVHFNYKEDGEDRTINTSYFNGMLMLEGAGFRQTPEGEKIAHMPVGCVRMEVLEDQLKAVYGALEDPDNWELAATKF